MRFEDIMEDLFPGMMRNGGGPGDDDD